MPCFIAVCKVTAYCEICKTILTISYFHGKGYWYLSEMGRHFRLEKMAFPVIISFYKKLEKNHIKTDMTSQSEKYDIIFEKI